MNFPVPDDLLSYRPKVEALEPRLPPGDALLGVLIAWPELTSELRDVGDAVVSAVSMFDDVTPLSVVSRSNAVNKADETAAATPEPTEQMAHSGAAGLIPAVYTAGINPAARHAGAINASASTPANHFASADFRQTAPSIPSIQTTSGGRTRIDAPNLRAIPAHAVLKPEAMNATQESKIAEDYGKLPLSFEENVGQSDSRVDFITRAGGGTVFLTPTAAVFSVQNSEFRIQNSESPDYEFGTQNSKLKIQNSGPGVALHMQLVGANPNAKPTGEQRQPGIVNYFIGNDPSQWHANVPTFGRVEYQDVYPGIDLTYYGKGQQLEYDFIVAPGAHPSAITLNFAAADGVEISPQGDLVLRTAAGDVVQQKPLTYQEKGTTRQEVTSRYVLDGTQVSFEVGAYDATRPLVIDPLVLGYSTYLGGALGDDAGSGITVDGADNAYVTGLTNSTKFPSTPGAFDTTYNGDQDAFVVKLNAAGSALAYGTYFGGSGYDEGHGIAVDGAGDVYVTGSTNSPDFPTTAGAFDTTFNFATDALVFKLSADGSALVYGTCLDGSDKANGVGIAVDGAGNAYVTGSTTSTDYPTTPGAFDTSFNGSTDVFVAKLSADGSTLVYGTYLGGSAVDFGWGIAVDDSGNAYVTGQTGSSNFPTTPGAFDTTFNGGVDAFVVTLSADGSTLAYTTYLGGSSTNYGFGITVDGAGNAYVTGGTASADFPTAPGAYDTTYNGDSDGFVVKLSADGSALAYGTYLGGSGGDVALGIAVDRAGNAYVTGAACAPGFPTTSGAFDSTFNGGGTDAFVVKLSADGSALAYATYLGGSGADIGQGIAVDRAGNAYVTGDTASTNFPTTPGALKRRNRGGTEASVTKFAEV